MTEERLKEIEARYEERSAALLADKWFWPEEDRLAWDSLAFVTDLVAALREARGLLGDLVASYVNLDSAFCPSCGMFLRDSLEERHKPDCPWLLAKQYLEPTPQ